MQHFRQVFIDGPDGNRIACYVGGRSGQRPAILTSGIGCGPIFVEAIARELSRDHRVVYWDYRGHGDSQPAPARCGYGIEDHAADLGAVVQAFAADNKPLLVSFSMGVQVQVEWTRRHPAAAAAHVFLLGVPRNPLHRTVFLRKTVANATDRVARASGPLLRLAQPAVQVALRTRLTYAVARVVGGVQSSCPSHLFGEFIRFATDVPLDAYLRCAAGLMGHDGTDAFARIDEPVLMLAAERDVLIDKKECRAFAARLKNGHFGVIHKASHASALECGRAIAADIRRFVEKTSSLAKAA